MYGLHNLALWPMGAESFSWWWVVNVLTWARRLPGRGRLEDGPRHRPGVRP